MVDPDRVVLVGQAFTGYPPVLEDVVAALHERSVLGPVDVSFTRFGAGVQAAAAGAVALGPGLRGPARAGPLRRRRRQPLSSLLPDPPPTSPR